MTSTLVWQPTIREPITEVENSNSVGILQDIRRQDLFDRAELVFRRSKDRVGEQQVNSPIPAFDQAKMFSGLYGWVPSITSTPDLALILLTMVSL
jgi:hypothetical protein